MGFFIRPKRQPDVRALGPAMPDEMHARRDAQLAEHASEQWTVVSTDQLRDAGLGSSSVSERVGRRRLFPMFRGSYCVGHEPLGPEPWIAAATLITDGEASHRSAAYLWDIRPLQPGEPIEVTTPRALRGRPARPAAEGRPAQPGLLAHRSAGVALEGATTIRGIRVVSAEQVLLDLAATRPYREARRATNQALVKKRITMASLLAKMERAHGHHGLRALRQIITTARPTRSEAEDQLAEMLRRGGLLHHFETNHLIDGVGEMDFYSPNHRFAIEVDGREFHDNPIARADDYAKQKRAEARDVVVMRVRWREVTVERAATADAIAMTLEERSRGVRALAPGMPDEVHGRAA